jgi:hypothetical protein
VGFLGADEGVKGHRPGPQVPQICHQALGLAQVEEFLLRQRCPPQLRLHVHEEPLKGSVGSREIGLELRQSRLLGPGAGGHGAQGPPLGTEGRHLVSNRGIVLGPYRLLKGQGSPRRLGGQAGQDSPP